jgi:hypothetical protein
MADLEGRIAELRRMHNALGDLVATCERPRSERACPLLLGESS